MHPVPTPPLAPWPSTQKNVQQSVLSSICSGVSGGAHVYAEQVPYGAPCDLSYWWSVTKTAKVCVSCVRVLCEHSAAWIAVETLAAELGFGRELREE